MSNRVVLLDLEHILPTAAMLRQLLEHNSLLFVFHADGKFQYALDDLTEFSSWVSSGQLIILEIPEVKQRSYEYAVLVGQLLALVEPDCQIELLSAAAERDLLVQFLHEAQFQCQLIPLKPDHTQADTTPLLSWSQWLVHGRQKLRFSLSDYLQHAALRTVVNRGLAQMATQPKFGIDQAASWIKQQLQGLEAQLAVRETEVETGSSEDLQASVADTAVQGASLALNDRPALKQSASKALTEQSQQIKTEKLTAVDLMHIEVIRRVNDAEIMPKDIYQLRDLLEKAFPEADVGMLLKTLIDQGYIYWNGHEVVYSHEMYLN